MLNSKNILWTITATLIALLLTGCATTSSDEKKYKETKYIQVKEESVSKITLRNGVVLIVKENKNGIVAFQVWFRTGARDEDASNAGISHFIEHLIFKGSEKLKVNELSTVIEGKGGELNGGTSKDYTNYHFVIAKEYFEQALDGMMDCVMNPVFDPAEIDKERKVVVEEIVRGLDNPGRVLSDKMFALSYNKHPYGRSVIGTKEIIEKVTREELVNYYKAHYIPGRMFISVVGDFDTARLINKLKKHLPAVESEKEVLKRVPADFKGGNEELETGFKQAYTAVSWLGPEAENNDTYAMDVLVTALGSGRSSRLFRNIKERAKLVYGIDAGYSTMRDEGLISVNAELDIKDVPAYEKKLDKELKDIRENGITASEFAKAVTIIENTYAFSHETNEEVAGALGYYEAISSYKQELNYLENIKKVTMNDVKNVALKYLSGKTARVLLKPKKVD